MVRSLSFGFYFRDLKAFLNLISFSLHILFKLATKINLLIHYTKGTLSLFKLQLIISIKFQDLFKLSGSFSPFLHSTGTLSSIKILRL